MLFRTLTTIYVTALSRGIFIWIKRIDITFYVSKAFTMKHCGCSFTDNGLDSEIKILNLKWCKIRVESVKVEDQDSIESLSKRTYLSSTGPFTLEVFL